MGKKPLVILEEDHERFRAILDEVRDESNAMLVFLLDKNGQQIAVSGELEGVDLTALASLAAGNVAATEGLGDVLGERRFQNLYHEGERASLYLTLVRNKLIMLIVFNHESSLGLVRLRVDERGDQLIEALDTVLERGTAGNEAKVDANTAARGEQLNQITDEDIDALFG